MEIVKLHINGLSHCDIADRREAFVREAVGKEVWIASIPCDQDMLCVGVFYETTRIGNVMADEAPLAQQVVMGAHKMLVTGEIVEAPSDYRLVAEFKVRELASMDEVRALAPCGLGTWTTRVATMMEWPELTRARLMCGLAQEKVGLLGMSTKREKDLRVAVVAIQELCRLMMYDLSRNMREERQLLLAALERRPEPELQEAKRLLEESMQRMGGDHVMADIAAWLKGGLPEQHEAKAIMAETSETLTRDEVVAEAKGLPRLLYALWETNVPEFARVLYGMRLTREEMRRVISCVMWMEVNGNGNVNVNGRSARSDAPGLENGNANGNVKENDNENDNVNVNGRATRGNQTNQEQIKQEAGPLPTSPQGRGEASQEGHAGWRGGGDGRSARSDAPYLENGNGNVNANGRSMRSDAPGLENVPASGILRIAHADQVVISAETGAQVLHTKVDK